MARPYRVDLTGVQFGRLTVVCEAQPKRPLSGGVQRKWRCRCSCTKIIEVSQGHLVTEKIRSCGCLRRELAAISAHRHGGRYFKIYDIWVSMIQRCENPKSKSYCNYGGRGIAVCSRWHDFALFNADMGPRPKGYQLERADNNKGYSPDNAHWATLREQANNKRRTIRIEFNGEVKPLTVWANELGLKVSTLYRRVVICKEPPEIAFRKLRGIP